MNVGDRIWWQHTASHVRYGTVKELTDRPGVQCDDGEWLYLDVDQITPFAEMPDGMYGWVTDADYHADRSSLSSSGARLLMPPSTPAHFKYRMDNPPKPKRAYDFGHLAHRLILGKGAEIVEIQSDDYRTKAAQAARDNAHDRGKIPALTAELAKARQMADAVYRHPQAAAILADGQAEMSMYATVSEVWAIRLRARPDWMTTIDGRVWLADLKTSTTAEPVSFARKAAEYRYHCQAAFYRRVAIMLGLEDPAFVMITIEKDAPHLVSVVEFDAEAIAEGERLNSQAILTYAQCVADNEWPAYSGDIVAISLPAWAIRRETIGDLLVAADD